MKTLSLLLVAVAPWATGWTDSKAFATNPVLVQEPAEEKEEEPDEKALLTEFVSSLTYSCWLDLQGPVYNNG